MIEIKFKPSVNKYLLKVIYPYIDWLSENYSFPKKITIDITGSRFVYNSVTAQKATATFFGPYDFSELNAYIKISTGNFFDDCKKFGKKEAEKILLESISHEIQHYYQWIDQIPFDEGDAEYGAEELTWEYIEYSRDNTEY
ncbi:hypothetical protein ACLI5Y_13855 [Enterococcus innesii]|uniref:hypothetical protein n=1 Tax=Enterococcus innesii TaxID=2839759 RepID=UPI00291586EE|nr:hypothetical protein [Enterococcus casseliflavus]